MPEEVSHSTDSFLASVYANIAILVISLVAFAIARKRHASFFTPRLLKLNNAGHRLPSDPASTVFGWIFSNLSMSDEQLLESVGLDGYMLIRFLKLGGVLSAGIVPLLVPLNAQGKRAAGA